MKSGWVTKKLGEVCEDSIRRLKEIDDSRFLYIDISSIDRVRKSIVGAAEYERIKAPGRAQQVVEAGDVLVSTVRPNLNAVAIVEGESDFQRIASTGFCVLRAGECVIPRYIYYFTQVDEFIAPLVAVSEKAAYPSVTDKVVKSVDIPIPPLAEQKRIVAKIDAAFEKIDALKVNAEKNLANAKELFQSALDEAMRLKTGWVEKRLGEIGSVCMCKRILKSETNTERGVPFYKIGTFGKTANAYISQETFDRYRKLYKFPRKGEILISAAGTIGRAVTYDGAPAYFQDSNIVWVANDEKEVLNQYLKWFYATSPWHVTKGATIQRLYNDNIESAQIAYPDICTQKQICQTLEISSQKTETLQQNYARQIADCAEMRQAILMEAFEGRL